MSHKLIAAAAALALLLGTVIALAAFTGGDAMPIHRIGLALPLEGEHRAAGLDMLFGARQAIRDALAAGQMSGYRVELTVYNDFGDPDLARLHAAALTADTDVLAVIGHAQPESTTAALPVYTAAGLPLITMSALNDNGAKLFRLSAAPFTQQRLLETYLTENAVTAKDIVPVDDEPISVSVGDAVWFVTGNAWPVDLPDGAAFSERLQSSDNVTPGQDAALAYDAVMLTLDAIDRAIAAGTPTRAAVAAALAATNYTGLTGAITFDANGLRQDAPVYLYQQTNSGAPYLLERLQ